MPHFIEVFFDSSSGTSYGLEDKNNECYSFPMDLLNNSVISPPACLTYYVSACRRIRCKFYEVIENLLRRFGGSSMKLQK